MKSKLLYILTFAAGVGVGVGATQQYFKRKYEKLINDDLKERIEEKKNNMSKEVEEETKTYTTITNNYVSKCVAKEEAAIKSEIEKDAEVPYSISPEEFAVSDYNTQTLVYYNNGYLTTENDEIVDDIEGTVGAGFENHFGEYEQDTIYIQNDYKEIVYEVLRDYDDFKED